MTELNELVEALAPHRIRVTGWLGQNLERVEKAAGKWNKNSGAERFQNGICRGIVEAWYEDDGPTGTPQWAKPGFDEGLPPKAVKYQDSYLQGQGPQKFPPGFDYSENDTEGTLKGAADFLADQVADRERQQVGMYGVVDLVQTGGKGASHLCAIGWSYGDLYWMDPSFAEVRWTPSRGEDRELVQEDVEKKINRILSATWVKRDDKWNFHTIIAAWN